MCLYSALVRQRSGEISQKKSAQLSETQRRSSTISLETETMGRCSRKIKKRRRTIAFVSNRARKQRKLATAGHALEKANEGSSCKFGACSRAALDSRSAHPICCKVNHERHWVAGPITAVL